MEDFKLDFKNGRLFAIAKINGDEYKMDVTEYFNRDNPHDKWLDFRLGLSKNLFTVRINSDAESNV